MRRWWCALAFSAIALVTPAAGAASPVLPDLWIAQNGVEAPMHLDEFTPCQYPVGQPDPCPGWVRDSIHPEFAVDASAPVTFRTDASDARLDVATWAWPPSPATSAGQASLESTGPGTWRGSALPSPAATVVATLYTGDGDATFEMRTLAPALTWGDPVVKGRSVLLHLTATGTAAVRAYVRRDGRRWSTIGRAHIRRDGTANLRLRLSGHRQRQPGARDDVVVLVRWPGSTSSERLGSPLATEGSGTPSITIG